LTKQSRAWRSFDGSAKLAWRRPGLALGFALALLVAAPAQAQTAASTPPRAVIIDTDPGTDDAMAILLALNSPEVDVKAFTVVPGNVGPAQALRNALTLAAFAGRCDIPIAGGAERPLAQELHTAEFVHGENGLANIELPVEPCDADPRFAPSLIVEMIHASPGEITLVPVGPLTNIALALIQDPSIVPLVKEVVIMGGSISEGNVTTVAEANIFNDPEAAQLVFQAGWKVTMIGLDVTHATLFDRSHLERLARTKGAQNDFAVEVMDFLIAFAAKYGVEGSPMHDPLAMGVAIDPSFVETRHMHIDVETRGEFSRGATVGNRMKAAEPNAHVGVEVEAERFMAFFIDRLAGK